MTPTPTDLAREAYAVHRAELAEVGTAYDPGPWEALTLSVRDIWIAHVEHVQKESKAA